MIDEEKREQWENVRYRMKNEGFHYCFTSYSSFKEIEDSKFHELRLAYLKSAKDLEEYVNKQLEE
jgi:hypothetical protein